MLNLESGEKIIWIFQEATYSTIQTHTSYVSRSQGVSIRLVKGLYYRIGESKGRPIKEAQLEKEGTGLLVITNLALYFLSSVKVLRVPVKNILAVEGFNDGISISTDSAKATPQFFNLDDPWFAANLLVKLKHFE